MNFSTPSAMLGAFCLLLLPGAAFPTHVLAQQDHPTFVVLPEVFPDFDARVVIVRQLERDVVVLHPAEATVEALGIGLMLLRRLRRESLAPGTTQMVPVTGFVMRRALSPARHERVEAALGRLRARPLGSLGSLGAGRWIRFGAR